MAWDCKRDGHRWREIDDWEGDPGVVGGVRRLQYWECSECGEIATENPDNEWEEENGEM